MNFLRGRTEYGDSIEDEWVVVWLLRELTKTFPNLWTKLSDTDGEFLLIEASGTLPTWLEPEVADNRVWINNAQLKIIKPSGSARSSKRTEEKLSLEEAHRIILAEPKRIMHSTSMEEEAFYRLHDYPEKIQENMHNAILLLPRKLAYLLLHKAAYVAPAVEAFYLRDPISLKPLQTKETSGLLLPPDDLVELSVRFPRVAYAQLKSQDFPVLDSWKSKMPATTETDARARAETGMKLTCGFEILLTDPQYQDRPVVREMNLLLEDLESGDATMPTDDELTRLEKRADDEKWLDISFDDLQQELGGKDGPSQGKKAAFGDKGAQENLQRIVKQFEAFLNDDKTGDEAGLFDEGDSDTDDPGDIDSDDLEEDKDASFDEDEFTKIMQEMMGMPPEVMKELRSGNIDALTNGATPQAPVVGKSASTPAEVEELSSDDDEEIEDLAKRMGAELKSSGALELESHEASSSKAIANNESGTVEDLSSSDDEDGLPGMSEQDAKNLLESLQAQGGTSGPAANLMEIMARQYAVQDEKKAASKGKKPA